MAADIALAQQRANNSSTSVTVSFNLASSSYQILGMPDLNQPAQTYTVSLAASPYSATLSAVSFGNGSSLTFNGFGMPQQGGSLRLGVADRQHTLTVDPSSGRVTIQ